MTHPALAVIAWPLYASVIQFPTGQRKQTLWYKNRDDLLDTEQDFAFWDQAIVLYRLVWRRKTSNLPVEHASSRLTETPET